MKHCPQCRQTYSDDTIFCLSDGTPLISSINQTEELTLVNPTQEQLTVVRSTQNTIPSVQPAPRGVSPVFAYLAGGLLILLLVIGAIGIGIFFWTRGSNTEVSKNTTPTFNGNKIEDQDKLNKEKANLQAQQDELEKERQRLAEERKKITDQKDKPTPPPITTPPSNTPYPQQPTARIKFSRGSVAESVSGKVYTQRSFVLEAKSGQYLSANVSSGGNCVVFSNGGTNLGYVTSSGDNRVTLVNNCTNEASFSLTVAIR